MHDEEGAGAIAALSPQATVAVDLRATYVDIDCPLTAAQVVAALAEGGYSAVCVREMA